MHALIWSFLIVLIHNAGRIIHHDEASWMHFHNGKDYAYDCTLRLGFNGCPLTILELNEMTPHLPKTSIKWPSRCNALKRQSSPTAPINFFLKFFVCLSSILLGLLLPCLQYNYVLLLIKRQNKYSIYIEYLILCQILGYNLPSSAMKFLLVTWLIHEKTIKAYISFNSEDALFFF